MLVFLDLFSHALHLIPSPSLPPVFELVKIMFNQVFRYFSPYKNVVSGRRGHNLNSKTSFLEILGATISLSSSYLPQFNGQAEQINLCEESEGLSSIFFIGGVLPQFT